MDASSTITLFKALVDEGFKSFGYRHVSLLVPKAKMPPLFAPEV
jgi:hypothetical protein